MAYNSTLGSEQHHARPVLGSFAQTGDETLCAGGAVAKYATTGGDGGVVSVTSSGMPSVRDASSATGANLVTVREVELRAAGQELGLEETRCLEHSDGPGGDPPCGLRTIMFGRWAVDLVVEPGLKAGMLQHDRLDDVIEQRRTSARPVLRPTNLAEFRSSAKPATLKQLRPRR
jgi:LmbE family N-acetylglucosaminyl deacetylase